MFLRRLQKQRTRGLLRLVLVTRQDRVRVQAMPIVTVLLSRRTRWTERSVECSRTRTPSRSLCCQVRV